METCFVIMGFGRKTDFETGRTLDLDKLEEYVHPSPPSSMRGSSAAGPTNSRIQGSSTCRLSTHSLWLMW